MQSFGVRNPLGSLSTIRILRNVNVKTYPFTDYFKDFEKIEAVRRIFGEKTEDTLRNLRVEFSSGRSYMGISDVDGHIRVSAEYLKKGDMVDIYLDVIHELFHVKQFMEGKKIFDENLLLVDETIEVEACSYVVEEARSLGMSDEQILEYLRTERMTEEDVQRLARALNLKLKNLEKRII